MKILKLILFLTTILITIYLNSVVFENQTGEVIRVRFKDAADKLITGPVKLRTLLKTTVDLGDINKYKLPMKIRAWLEENFNELNPDDPNNPGYGMILKEENISTLKKDDSTYSKILKKGVPNVIRILYDPQSKTFDLVYKRSKAVEKHIIEHEKQQQIIYGKQEEEEIPAKPVEQEKGKVEYANIPLKHRPRSEVIFPKKLIEINRGTMFEFRSKEKEESK
ncbi:hypothetical protein M1446_00050 [Candidatus Dependentiae bacterium]|nr:hypothetical protein [Candidatus Dependentiae bacterium]